MLSGFKKIAFKILALDDTQLPEEQFEFIFESIQKQPKFKNNIVEKREFLNMLKQKHGINSIIVTDIKNGTILIGDKPSRKQAIEKMKELLTNNDSILIRKKFGWDIYVANNGNAYLISANSDLTQAELKALAREVEEFLNKSSQIH